MVLHQIYPPVAIIDVCGKVYEGNLQVLIALAAGDGRYDRPRSVGFTKLAGLTVLDNSSTVFLGNTPVVVEEMHAPLLSARVEELRISAGNNSKSFLQARSISEAILLSWRAVDVIVVG